MKRPRRLPGGASSLRGTSLYKRSLRSAVQEDKRHYEVAQAQALMQPKSPMAGFIRSFVASQVFKAGGEDE